jgi:hypothetical protein
MADFPLPDEEKQPVDTVLEVHKGTIDVNLILGRMDRDLKSVVTKEGKDGKIS